MLSEINAILAAALSQNITLYHGTPSTDAYKSIRASGIKPRLTKGDKGTNAKMAPMIDSVYLTKKLPYAMIYAFNGNTVGKQLRKDDIIAYKNDKNIRYGYIFTIDSDNLVNTIKPDEDAIGEMYHALVNEIDYEYDSNYNNKSENKVLPYDKIPKVIGTIANAYASDNMRLKAKNYDDYGDLSRIGKKIIKYMSPALRLRMAELTDSISADSIVIPEHCYRIDKLDRAKYNSDGSNFFELAKQMY